MADEIDLLRKHVQELENVAFEYSRLRDLIDYAAQGQDLSRYMGMSALYVDPDSHQIVEANEASGELLGYPPSELLKMRIDDLEISAHEGGNADETSGVDSTAPKVYSAVYKRCDGYSVTVTVNRQLLKRDNRPVLYYRVADISLHRRLWYELQRREDDGFNFQQKLTMLNEVTVELSKIESFDGLCYQIVKLGVERLGFDRLGLWLVDHEQGVMRGTYGVDEHGHIRDERDQNWSYAGRHVSEFISGKTDKPLIFDDAPLYNEKSEIVRYGWHVTVPVLHGQRCLGTLAADNFRRSKPIRNYEPELLRLYGITIAHLMELSRSREQATALRVAQQLTEMLSEFITNVGHDFRTPLSIISNKAYLLQHAPDGERRQSMAAGIYAQVQHISGMVNRALEFVALQKEPTLQQSRINLNTMLTRIVRDYQSEMAAKNTGVDMMVDGGLDVLADALYLNRALSEIFENAVHFTGQDGHIQVGCIVYPQEIGICIRDNGVGMSKETLNRAFDPLYRDDRARTERRSGLGLAITKAIVEAHGGRIHVESVEGKGTTLEVIFAKG